jgi:anti-sigma factor ChrR (cupin superfamily)
LGEAVAAYAAWEQSGDAAAARAAHRELGDLYRIRLDRAVRVRGQLLKQQAPDRFKLGEVECQIARLREALAVVDSRLVRLQPEPEPQEVLT